MSSAHETDPAAPAEAAETAFWCALAAACPEIKTGDLDPAEAARFSAACRDVVAAWLAANAPAAK